MADLSLSDLMRLARILGRSIGVGYARTLIEAEDRAAQQLPPTKTQATLDTLVEGFEEWAREAVRTPRAKGSAQERHLELVLEFLQHAAAERRDGP